MRRTGLWLMARKPRLRKWYWTDPLYFVRIYMLHGPWNLAFDWMQETFEKDITRDLLGGASAGKTIWMSDPQDKVPCSALIFWYPSSCAPAKHTEDAATVAHEAFHGVAQVLLDRGMELGNDSEEAFAYYLTWLYREQHRRLTA